MLPDWVIYLIVFFVASDLVLVVWLVVRRRKMGLSDKSKSELAALWQEILSRGVRREAVLELDKLLDLALQKRGYTGSLGEKLKATDKVWSRKQAVWDAHKLRNRLAHELNAKVSERELQTAVSGFRQALRDLGVPV